MGNKAETELDSIRLDKWLWAARFFKTRTLSQDNIELGRVKVNKARAKASKEVRVGDELEIFRGSERFIVIVKALSGKEARLLLQRLFTRRRKKVNLNGNRLKKPRL